MSIITHEVNSIAIGLRAEDGYVNLTKMIKATNASRDSGDHKQVNHYLSNKVTKSFLDALSVDTGIPVSELVQIRKGGKVEQGTWAHPQVAIHCAQWCSPEFAVMVTKWVFEWMTQGKTPQLKAEEPTPPPNPDPVPLTDAVKAKLIRRMGGDNALLVALLDCCTLLFDSLDLSLIINSPSDAALEAILEQVEQFSHPALMAGVRHIDLKWNGEIRYSLDTAMAVAYTITGQLCEERPLGVPTPRKPPHAPPRITISTRAKILGYKPDAGQLILIGQRAAKLYQSRHGVAPAKEETLVNGTLYPVNAYYESDIPLVDAAIRSVMNGWPLQPQSSEPQSQTPSSDAQPSTQETSRTSLAARAKALGFNPDAEELVLIGKRAAKYYRTRHGVEPPQREVQVDGQSCLVSSYSGDDAVLVDIAIKSVMESI